MFWWVTLWLFANSVNITQMTNIFIDSLLSSWFSEHENWEYYRIIIPMQAVVANCKLHCHLHFHLKLSVGDWEVHNEFIICTWTDVLLAFQFQISSALNIEHYTSTHTRPGLRPRLNKGPAAWRQINIVCRIANIENSHSVQHTGGHFSEFPNVVCFSKWDGMNFEHVKIKSLKPRINSFGVLLITSWQI